MLDILRRYQKVLFLVVTVMVVFSFVFFGTYSALGGVEGPPDRALGKRIDGSSMNLSEVQRLSRFIATDREDSILGRGLFPNFCNDGVIRYDFIKDGLANLIARAYFDILKNDFEARIEKAKRFKPYAHPENPVVGAKAVWGDFFPDLYAEICALQEENRASIKGFSHLEKLYLYQSRLKPEMLRQILVHRHQQYPWLNIDEKLSYEDLALFGFHSASDWFGHNFVDLISEFILNAAAAAEKKGYQVTLQEAKGDLIHCFQETMEKLKEAKAKPDFNFQAHLRMLGFDETTASETWQKVLLFRRYFQDLAEAAFVDTLPYKDFARFSKESAILELYRAPILVQSSRDLAELQFYIKAISKETKEGFPVSVLPMDEIEKKVPELIQKTVRAKVAEVSKKQLALRISLKELWSWELEHWDLICKKFSLQPPDQLNERFTFLENSLKRDEIDSWAREKIVDENPAWAQEALADMELSERSWSLQGSEEPTLKSEGTFYRLEGVEVVRDKHLLSFREARQVLSKLVPRGDGDFDKETSPFVLLSKKALRALQRDRNDVQWVQSGLDPIMDQFRLEKRTEAILRTSKEGWMREQAFMMAPEMWSSVHIDENGEIVFFYLQEKRAGSAPVLEQLTFGKQMLATDAKIFAAERLLKVIQEKNAIVIPLQKEDE